MIVDAEGAVWFGTYGGGLARLAGGEWTTYDTDSGLPHNAVRSLLDAYASGQDGQARLALLSTYLGHVDPAATYWYLSAAPELLALAGQRLEHHLAGQP